MHNLLLAINVSKLTSLLSSGFLICLVLLIIALYRNLKLKAENERLRNKTEKSRG
ncbi:hypothetical protein [Robertkochia aurantiaca]|uniref:hypothetical protein n=1 Tax=Robertkochia aurantiaca TaxID=2873700 RepID=UPI001CCEE444|nr:hypothetical protein [Robertkochia sp. 3YJGBD-33]